MAQLPYKPTYNLRYNAAIILDGGFLLQFAPQIWHNTKLDTAGAMCIEKSPTPNGVGDIHFI